MAILRTTCPECQANLTSKTGFTVGKMVSCPKCETFFEVTTPSAAAKPTTKQPAAIEDDDEDRPRKKKRSRDEEDEEDRPARKKKQTRRDEEDDDEEEERPRKKKRRKERDEESGGYKNSPIRFVVLGVLVLVMIVLGIFLVLKMMKDRENANSQLDRIQYSWVAPT